MRQHNTHHRLGRLKLSCTTETLFSIESCCRISCCTIGVQDADRAVIGTKGNSSFRIVSF